MLLIHIVDDWKVATGDIATVNLEAGSRRLRQAGQALLREAEARVRQAGVPVTTVLLEELGLPVGACIVQRARDCQLISSYAERTGAVACARCFWAATQNHLATHACTDPSPPRL